MCGFPEGSRLEVKPTMGGFDVLLTRYRKKPLAVGHVDGEGFFLPVEHEFVRLTPKQLREIADFTERHMAGNKSAA